MIEGYIKISDLLDFCDNQKDHSVTPNDIMRMNHSYFTENYPCWISVKDRLPTESDGTVLVCYPNQAPYNLMEPHINAKHDRRVATGCYSQHSRTWYHGDMRGVGGADPIAWMPLPEPPKEEEHAAE